MVTDTDDRKRCPDCGTAIGIVPGATPRDPWTKCARCNGNGWLQNDDRQPCPDCEDGRVPSALEQYPRFVCIRCHGSGWLPSDDMSAPDAQNLRPGRGDSSGDVDQGSASPTDTERLDFLGNAPDNIRFIVTPLQPHEGDWTLVYTVEHYRNTPIGQRTIRDAIDRAMKENDDA